MIKRINDFTLINLVQHSIKKKKYLNFLFSLCRLISAQCENFFYLVGLEKIPISLRSVEFYQHSNWQKFCTKPSTDIAAPSTNIAISSAVIAVQMAVLLEARVFYNALWVFHYVLWMFHDVLQVFHDVLRVCHDVLRVFHDVLQYFTMFWELCDNQ